MARTEEYGLGPLTYPRGWFMIATAADIGNTPQAVRFFGRDMVLYRGKRSGNPILLDAYCPHMRVHLAKNTTSYVVRDGNHVEGDSIRCPPMAGAMARMVDATTFPIRPAPFPRPPA